MGMNACREGNLIHSLSRALCFELLDAKDAILCCVLDLSQPIRHLPFILPPPSSIVVLSVLSFSASIASAKFNTRFVSVFDLYSFNSPRMSQHPQADDSALAFAPGDADDPQALTAADLEVEPPLSPWVEHFGLQGYEPGFFGSNHTWIAPREPPVDPVPAGRPSGITLYDVKGRLHAQDYDDLFLSERLQVSRFKGLRTREAQVLSQVDAHELPDESPWFTNKNQHRMIEVREGEHLSIFKKERWLNNNNPMKDKIGSVRGEAIPDGQGWSVDYKPLWKELSLCLELADRILKHSFKGPW